MKNSRRLFIVIEGIDGSGKTTCAKMLAKMMRVHYYKTPPPIFESIRAKIDLAGDLVTRFLFYLAALSNASTEIKRLLESRSVVCDRFSLSTIACHRALGVEVSSVDFDKLPIIKPDITFCLTADEETIRKRLSGRKNKSTSDKWMEKNRVLQQRIEKEFLAGDVIKIDTSSLTLEKTCQKMLAIINLSH